MLGGNWTLDSFLSFLRFRFIHTYIDPNKMNEQKVCKVMTRSCTFQTSVYVYASNIE
jgi:hypothetical protein